MIKDRASVEALIPCLKDKVIEVRIGAAHVLGKLGDMRAIGPLKILEADPFIDVRDAAAEAIQRLR